METENLLDVKEKCVKELTEVLPVLRKMNNLTQQDLGEIIGVSRQTITNIESGKAKMQWPVFLSLMFIFSLEKSSQKYLLDLDIPYDEIRQWLFNKRGL